MERSSYRDCRNNRQGFKNLFCHTWLTFSSGVGVCCGVSEDEAAMIEDIVGRVSRQLFSMETVDNDAIQVFKKVAFKGREDPPSDELSVRACNLAQCLPAALKAFGTFLYGMNSVEEWEKALRRLEEVPHQRIMEILRTSYTALDRIHRVMFLHVACLFNGDSVRRVTSLVDGELEIKGLAEKSLIDITTDGFINMHSLVEQAGREFVREESDSTPWRQRILWEQEQISSVLQNNTGTATIQSLALHMCEMPRVLYIEGRVFKTIDLRYLKVFQHLNDTESKLQFLAGEDDLPKQLRLLHWDSYPLQTLPPSYCEKLHYLVEINLRFSKIERMWRGNPELPMLRRLDMTCSRNLWDFPGLAKANKLEELLMEGSTSLKRLPRTTISSLSCLQTLNLSHCDGLKHSRIFIFEKEVPLENSSRRRRRQILLQFSIDEKKIGSLANLSIDGSIDIILLHFKGHEDHISCISEQKTPEEMMRMLGEGVPCNSSFFEFKLLHIKRISYNAYRPFECDTFSGLPFLMELKMINLNINKIPDDIDHLQSLEKLDLSGNDFKSLPKTMVKLSKLRSLRLCNCSNLEALPELTQLQTLNLSSCLNLTSLLELSHDERGGIYGLLELGLDNCRNVQSLSDQLCNFPSLIHLDLSRHDFETIPQSIRELTSLATICLNNCKKLTSVEELPLSLKHLYAHGCVSLDYVSLSWDNCIEHLDLSYCLRLKQGEFLFARILNDGVSSRAITPRFACLAGEEVPSYLDNQAQGTSTRISLPLNRFTSKMLGLAACVMISCKTPFHLQFPEFTCSLSWEGEGAIRMNLKPNLYCCLSEHKGVSLSLSLHHLVVIFVPIRINTDNFDELRLESHLQLPEEFQIPPAEIIACGARVVFSDREDRLKNPQLWFSSPIIP
ncbi:unnamed protein product [Eruca vesicaria subsp. sativa]|uniref:NB-ARC domain-containing protein n=1 Tax=Eruca vesicaria subsp. sativa TaxID=29727 RepID=A0ABC8KN18_ERUVS|nr:unnamed protein product [Eruca vesicaria subsp. sativa]